MLFSPSSSPTKTSSSPAASSLLESIFSYDGNVMVAAIISLLLVILFVLLLHVYAKWFLAQARQRSRGSSMSHVLGPARFHHFNTITIDTSLSSTPTKGLEAHVISTIPLFVYESKLHNSQQEVLECAICLSIFEDQEMGRKLSKCGHAFHVECIDMWLHAHTNCPICRAPAMIMTSDHKGVNQTTISDVVVVEDLNSIRSGSSMSELSPGTDIVVEIPSSDSEDNVVLGGRDSLSDCSSSSSLSSINGSLKRMLSRNSLEGKVHPSPASDESDY